MDRGRPYAGRGIGWSAPRRRRRAASWVAGLIAVGAVLAAVTAGVAATQQSLVLRTVAATVRPGPSPTPESRPAIASKSGVATRTDPPVTSAAPPPEATIGDEAPAPTAEPTTRPHLAWETNAPEVIYDPDLALQLDGVLRGVDGQIGVAVKDLGSGRGVVLGGETELPAASLYKLGVLYTIFASGVPMSDELVIDEDALSYDSGTMELGVGEQLTVAEAVERMVTVSDNTSAILLAGRVGAARINANLAALGMPATHFSAERMNTSAVDMLNFLELLARGHAVSPAASADMIHLLLRQRVNDRIPALLPSSVEAAHKTGNLPGTVNDVGILYGPDTTVVVAVLVSGTSDETGAAAAIARTASIGYDYFAGAGTPPGPTIPPAPSRPVPPIHRQPSPPTPTPEPTLAPRSVGSTTARPALPTPTRAAPATAAPAVEAFTPTPLPAATPTAEPTRPPTLPPFAVVQARTTAPPVATSPPAPARTPTPVRR